MSSVFTESRIGRKFLDDPHVWYSNLVAHRKWKLLNSKIVNRRNSEPRHRQWKLVVDLRLHLQISNFLIFLQPLLQLAQRHASSSLVGNMFTRLGLVLSLVCFCFRLRYLLLLLTLQLLILVSAWEKLNLLLLRHLRFYFPLRSND